MYEKKHKARAGNSIIRLLFCILIIICEVHLIFWLMNKLDSYAVHAQVTIRVVAFIAVLRIYSQNKTSTMKMPWIIMIMLFPIQAITIYLITGNSLHLRKMRTRYSEIDNILFPLLPYEKNTILNLHKQIPRAGNISQYLINLTKYPVYCNTNVQYFSDALDAIEQQIQDFEKAEKFIFLEYFAIENEIMWNRIQDVLEKKVLEGVEVRVFYDDIGSIGFINLDFINQLKSIGIKCRVFNPFIPGLNLFLNNRDHRKITVIDGKIAYTGGYNIADRYFHIGSPYGVWKDCGIRMEGGAVNSMTVTFLEMWNAVRKDDIDDTVFDHYINKDYNLSGYKGYVQPYRDSPLDDEQVGEEVYISLLNKAERYCYFTTPYLIITDEMRHAMVLASKRGVDVRIVTPGIPDKKLIYSITRSFYNGLVKNGVRIYEWTPGFVHSKLCVVDDIMATCGTINLDYRSLYHHFENGCLLIDNPAVIDIRNDCIKTFEESNEVTDIYKSRKVPMRLGQMFLRFFAPLL